VIAAGFFLWWLVAVIQGALPPRKLVKWRSLEGAVAAAAAEHKPILYDFWATWCGPCNQMDREVFSNAKVAGFINGNFIPVRVTDDDHGPGADALRSQHGVDVLPTLLVIPDSRGEPHRLEGFHDKAFMLAFLERALEPALATSRPSP
jgi:thiol:disulfide interchange protein